MVGLGALEMENACHGSIAKPGEVLEGQEQLPIADEEPYPVWRDAGDLNLGSRIHEGILHAPRIGLDHRHAGERPADARGQVLLAGYTKPAAYRVVGL